MFPSRRKLTQASGRRLELEDLTGCARILLCDDHQATLETVARRLAVEFDVVGSVENGELAVRAAASLDPDVVILDISMPVMNGIEAASRIKKFGSRAKLIFLTGQTHRDFVTAAFSTGARGYVLKPYLMTDLVPAIREVLEGRIFASPSLGIGETSGIQVPAEVQDEKPAPVGQAEACPEESRKSPILPGQPVPPRAGRTASLAAGAAVLAAVTTGAVFYGRQSVRQSAAPRPTEAQQRQVDQLKREDPALRDRLERLGQSIAAQQREIQDLHAELEKVTKTGEGYRRTSEEMRAQAEESANRNTQLLADLRTGEKSLAVASAELERISRSRTEDQASLVAQQSRINDLSEQLHIANANVDFERQLLAAGRDVTQLIGARQLHVVDVRDTDPSGKPRKAFGRIFLAEGKSLIFYVFDLNEGKLLEAKHSFQVWGEQEGKKTSVRSLGLLHVDDKAQKRWALKLQSPALLKEIDAVFVTFEPPGGSKQPSGQRFLYAYLGEANHS